LDADIGRVQGSQAQLPAQAKGPTALESIWSYCQRNPQLVAGLALMLGLLTFVVLGGILMDLDKARPLSSMPDMEPSGEYPLGTDTSGRDMLAVMIVGTPLTLKIGLIAAAIGLGVGIVLGFNAG